MTGLRPPQDSLTQRLQYLDHTIPLFCFCFWSLSCGLVSLCWVGPSLVGGSTWNETFLIWLLLQMKKKFWGYLAILWIAMGNLVISVMGLQKGRETFLPFHVRENRVFQKRDKKGKGFATSSSKDRSDSRYYSNFDGFLICFSVRQALRSDQSWSSSCSLNQGVSDTHFWWELNLYLLDFVEIHLNVKFVCL